MYNLLQLWKAFVTLDCSKAGPELPTIKLARCFSSVEVLILTLKLQIVFTWNAWNALAMQLFQAESPYFARMSDELALALHGVIGLVGMFCTPMFIGSVWTKNDSNMLIKMTYHSHLNSRVMSNASRLVEWMWNMVLKKKEYWHEWYDMNDMNVLKHGFNSCSMGHLWPDRRVPMLFHQECQGIVAKLCCVWKMTEKRRASWHLTAFVWMQFWGAS